MRNIFKSGPNDGEVYLTSELFTDLDLLKEIPWDQYDGDKVEPYEMADGLEAREWHWKGDPESPLPITRFTPNGIRAGESYEQFNARRNAEEAGLPTDDESIIGDNILEAEESDAEPSKPAERVEESAPVDSPSDSLEARRKALKLSRKAFGERSGMTESAIYRCENGKGKPEEIAVYEQALGS